MSSIRARTCSRSRPPPGPSGGRRCSCPSWPRSPSRWTWPRGKWSSTRRQACSTSPGAARTRWAAVVKIDIITIFPEDFTPLRVSLLGKAAERGIIEFAVHDLRAWAQSVHRSANDSPFGGGPGMVMSPGPWGEALDAVIGAGAPGTRLILPTPSGVPFRQEMAAAYARSAHLVFACGRYEGIDARFADDARARVPVDEVSVGDYVLSGGGPAVLVMIDAISRLLPGVLGNADSAPDDSFGGGGGPMAGLLEGPGVTRPRERRGREGPPRP